jgi:hypothetical protein
MRLDPCRMPIAAARLGGSRPLLVPDPQPAHRGRHPDPEARRFSESDRGTCSSAMLLDVCQRGCPVPDQAASLILRSLVSRSGLRHRSPIGDQLRIWRDHRVGLAARASAWRWVR